MAQIQGFSPVVHETLNYFYNSHPVYRLEQRREMDMGSPLVHILEGRCDRCGLCMTPSLATFPSDLLRATTLFHDWTLDRNEQCGGQVMFETSPIGAT